LEIDSLKKSLETTIVLLDILDKSRSRKIDTKSDLDAGKYKVNFIKEKLLLNILENKEICEKLIKKIENA